MDASEIIRTVGGQQAYPGQEEEMIGKHEWRTVFTQGMTKREVMAMSALQGILSTATPPNLSNNDALQSYIKNVPRMAVALADALLVALNTEKEGTL